MPKTTIQDRAAGAIMGAFIGDALGLGPHWYYDLAELRRNYGEWITDYTDPKPGRYHEGLKAGQLSQAGFILALTLRSLVERGGYDEADFTRRMDEELFPLLDGTPVERAGRLYEPVDPGGLEKASPAETALGQTGGHADDTEAIERTLAIAVRYALHPGRLAAAVAGNTVLTQTDDTVVSMTVAFCAVLGLLVQGNALDAELSDKLMGLVKTGELPFHAVTRANFSRPAPVIPTRRGPADSPRRMPCSRRPTWPERRRIRISASNRRGKCPSFTACLAPSTTSSLPPTTLPPVSATISNPPCSTPSTAEDRTRRAPSSPAPSSGPRPASPAFRNDSLTDSKILPYSVNWL